MSINARLKLLYSQCRELKKNKTSIITEGDKELLMKSPIWAYRFCRSIYKSRQPWLEPTLLEKSPKFCYSYSRFVIKGRWEESEKCIGLNPRSSFNYAKFVINDRFEVGEISIISSPKYKEKYLAFLKTIQENVSN